MAVTVTSAAHFSELMTAADARSHTVVNLWAPWCEPAVQQMNPVCSQLAASYPAVRFLFVDADALPEVSEGLQVSSVPYFLFFRGNKLVHRLEGANVTELAARVRELAAEASSGAAAAATSATAGSAGAVAGESLSQRLTRLISYAPVMVFMKGTPDAPRCGYSRQLVELLRKHNCAFSSFDILSDEEVRVGLKDFSKWPTYPQLYVNSKLVGGLDIAKELDADGELAALLAVAPADDSARLRALINQAPIMLFMKGDPSAPRCGFSSKMVELLRSNGVEFGSFDILSDNTVREGLKKFSNWPTYPQLYAKGKLIGGLDIVKELAADGELKEALGL